MKKTRKLKIKIEHALFALHFNYIEITKCNINLPFGLFKILKMTTLGEVVLKG